MVILKVHNNCMVNLQDLVCAAKSIRLLKALSDVLVQLVASSNEEPICVVNVTKTLFNVSDYKAVGWFAKQFVWGIGNAFDETLNEMQHDVGCISLDSTNRYQRKKHIFRYIVAANEHFANEQITTCLFAV